MDLAMTLFEDGTAMECAEALGTAQDGYEYGTSKDKARAVVGIGSSLAAGAVADSMLAGAAIGGPIGFVIGGAAGLVAATVAKTVYDVAQES
jgi:hypothetical protein